MRVLQVVATVDGANWAVDQATYLAERGIEVHVALPKLEGIFIDDWRRSGARLCQAPITFPLRAPWRFGAAAKKEIRNMVSEIKPDVIHSHFVNSTLALRYALGRNHPIPRLFQVPGPFHMEHGFFRKWELSSAGANDCWIASSRYTRDLYLRSGVPEARLYLSYYGNSSHALPDGDAGLRDHYGIGKERLVVGNVNYMYAPRLYLGQTKGIKRHEDVIDALGELISHREDVVGLIVGGQWGGGSHYEQRLKVRAAKVGRGRVIMTGRLSAAQAKSAWVDFDVAVHVPTSENCGGVIEPLMAGVPVIAARTGGLPEVILDGLTGKLVAPRDPRALAASIEEVLDDLPRYQHMAQEGRRLVSHMFDVKRTAEEVALIYEHLLDPTLPRPEMFDSSVYLQSR